MSFLRPSSFFFDDPFTRAFLHPEWPYRTDHTRRSHQQKTQAIGESDHSDIQRRGDLNRAQDQGHSLWPIFSGFGLVPNNLPSNALQPRLDLHEEPDRFKLSVEVAGVSKDNVKVTVDDEARRVTISGEVRSEYDSDKQISNSRSADNAQDSNAKNAQQERKSVPIISERIYGSFTRSLTLPDTANLEGLRASFEEGNGVLSITVPKFAQKASAKEKERSVNITTSPSPGK